VQDQERGIAMLKNLFTQNKKGSQAEFWEWFVSNETRIWDIDRNQEKVIRMVSEALNRLQPGLTFEIGMDVVDGQREFILSADGISSNIPKVESLYLSAPVLARWRIIKYRQRSTFGGKIRMAGKEISAEDVRFQIFNDGEKVGILLLFEDFTQERRNQFAGIGFILLDKIIGEQDVMTRVGFVDLAGPESNFYADAHRLPELPKAFDEYFHNI
jgi:hypothetical protein